MTVNRGALLKVHPFIRTDEYEFSDLPPTPQWILASQASSTAPMAMATTTDNNGFTTQPTILQPSS